MGLRWGKSWENGKLSKGKIPRKKIGYYLKYIILSYRLVFKEVKLGREEEEKMVGRGCRVKEGSAGITAIVI